MPVSPGGGRRPVWYDGGAFGRGETMTRGPFPAGRVFVAERLVRPAQAFVHAEASGGIVLLAAALLALAWANSPWDGAYHDLWHARLRFDFNLVTVDDTLGHLVNDGLMTVFFFVAGLEIKRELLHGELASPRRAALPVAAALGGMVVPAGIYAVFNAGSESAHGWGIPMATDIAFSLGVLALLGRRAPFNVKVFLLALAIVDDLGAIAVIAVFYTESVSLAALGWAAAATGGVLVARRAGVANLALYVALGAALWLAVYSSGVHATLAGVVLAVLTPATAVFQRERFEGSAGELLARFRAARSSGDAEAQQATLGEFERLVRGSESPLTRLERGLHPWVSYLVVPVFALANAGVPISREALSDAATSGVTAGVALGLVLGKPVGILLFSWVAVRFGIATLPANVRMLHVAGVGLLAGIGFTVSLFVTGLAFTSEVVEQQAKMGILGASAVAGVLGYFYLWFAPGDPAPAEDAAVAGRSATA